MPSEIYVDKIMDQTGANSLFEQSGNNWISGSGFPSGHVVQTVYQRTHAITADSSASGSSVDASHLEKSITITAGNSVYYMFNFSNRIYANGTDWAGIQFYVYHKEGSGSYANAESGPTGSNLRHNLYYDEGGNLPSSFYNDTSVTINGIHTPSSGTVHSYKMYYRFNSGSSVEIGIGANTGNQYVILQEIQA